MTHPSDPKDHALPPGLERFVVAARTQPIVGTCVTAEAVSAGLEHQRRRNQGRRMVGMTVTMAIAAGLAGLALLRPMFGSGAGSSPLAQSDESAELTSLERPTVTIPTADAPVLADAIRFRSTAPVEVRGPWTIVLREGSHEIELEPGAGQVLEIVLPDRTLELVEGRVHVGFEHAELGVPAAVRLETGVAAWVAEDGMRTQIRVDRIELDPAGKPGGEDPGEDPGENKGPSAAALARTAEDLLAAGNRDRAIATYQQLVRKHPHASQTRGAVLDLARLLRNAKREDEARCAYRLYLDRWPDSSVRGEVEAQLARLGPGPACPKR